MQVATKLDEKSNADMANPDAAFDENKSNFRGQNLSPTARNNLRAFMSEWVQTTARLDKNIVGYTLTSQQPHNSMWSWSCFKSRQESLTTLK